MTAFNSRLCYSFGNEDSGTELKALRPEPHHRILCITASGDRPLNLLMTPCKEIISLDRNPSQNHLLELKCSAMRSLGVEEYLQFLGVNPCSSRCTLFTRIADSLSPGARDFWEQNLQYIRKGVIYQGAIERLIRFCTYPMRLMRRNEINQLFSQNNLEDQKKFMSTRWNHKLWKTLFKLALHPTVSRILSNEPGMYAYLDNSISPGPYLYDKFERCLENNLANQSPMVSLIFRGSVQPEALPPYLNKNYIETIRPRLAAIKSMNSEVITYLESVPENSFDRFSLSDVVSDGDHTHFLRLLKAIYRTAKPGARFCLRQLMTRYKIPEGLKPYFALEPQLEKELEQHDLACFYRFTIGAIQKDL